MPRDYAKHRATITRRYREIKARIDQIKTARGCESPDCAWRASLAPAQLDFHHVRGVKDFEIGEAGSFGWQRIEAEIGKCIVLCANCHRATHAKGQGWCTQRTAE